VADPTPSDTPASGSEAGAPLPPPQPPATTTAAITAKPAAGRVSWASAQGFPRATLAAFVVYAATALWLQGTMFAAVALGVLLGMVALWFIYCVTGDAEADKKCDSLFTFAYAFTFGAFALLLMPVLSDQIPHQQLKESPARSEGALRLVRGCVQVGAAGSRTLGAMLAPCPPAPAASMPALPTGIVSTGYRYAWLVSVGGVTARTLAVDKCDEKSQKAALEEDNAVAANKALKEAQASPASAPAAASAASSAAQARQRADAAWDTARATCSAHGTEDPKRPFVEVTGGVAVPLFVVVLALIGGAVSISRRIPEIQRRNDRGYVPTADEPAMPAFRVREAVVFQIMQLVSAPFLAIATLQVIEPNNLASASTLAFATGFFSETILYMIRGMVNGLKPELSKVAGSALVNLVGQLQWRTGTDPGDFTTLRVELRSTRPIEWRNVPVEKDGKFVVNGVSAGRYQLVVAGGGIEPVPALDIDIGDKAPEPVKITVAKKV